MIILTGITWLTTYNCNLNCRHCFFDSQGTEKYMDPELVDLVLKDFKHGDIMFWQHLSGGEIFLNETRLFDILSRIRKYFKKSVGISTNAYWADTDDKAEEISRKLKKLGVTGIAVSSDEYHQEFLSPEYPRRLINALVKEKLSIHSYVMGAVLQKDIEGYEQTNQAYHRLAASARNGLKIPLAPTKVRSIGKGSAINVPKKDNIPSGYCTDLSECLGTRSPFNPAMVWIDPYGNVMVCYGIIIGNVYRQSFNDIIAGYSENHNIITKIIAHNGPKGLYELALEKGYKFDNGFYDECDLCYQSRSILQKDFPEILGPGECYPL